MRIVCKYLFGVVICSCILIMNSVEGRCDYTDEYATHVGVDGPPTGYILHGELVTAGEFYDAMWKSLGEETDGQGHIKGSKQYDMVMGTRTWDGWGNSGNGRSTSPISKPKAQKVTAKFVNLYGVILGTSKITKGTDIAKSQFPKETPPDITTSNGVLSFDRWDYNGKPLENDITVKALYKKVY